ncbi:MAG: glycosyltransferase family 39 protein [candidate division FCPU426 bacterium]
MYHLGHQSLWLDEIGQVITASSSWHDLFRIVGTHLSPPLDYILLKFFLVFGKADWIVRLPAAIYGILSIPVFYLLARYFIGKTQAWVPTMYFTLSPMAIAYSQEARMYSLFLLLSLVSLYLTVRWCEEQSWPWAIGLGAVNGLLLLTHYFGMFVMVIEGLYWLWRYKNVKITSWKIPQAVVNAGISLLIFSPWVPLLLNQFRHAEHTPGYGMPFLPLFFSVLLSQYSSIGFFNGWYYGFALLFLLGTIMAIIHKNHKLVVLASAFVIMLVSLFLITSHAQIVTTRNTIFLLPIYLLVVGYGTSILLELIPGPKWLKNVMVVGILLFPVYQYHLQPSQYSKQDYKTVANYLREHMEESSKVLVVDLIERGCLAYYLEPSSDHVYVRSGYFDQRNRDGDSVWVLNDVVKTRARQDLLKAWLVLTNAQDKTFRTIPGIVSTCVLEVGSGDKALMVYSLAAESADK